MCIKDREGRFFNESESVSGSPVIVLGHEIANNLFGNSNPLGQEVRLYGRKMQVIGVLEKQGSSLFGNSRDGQAFVPVNLVRRIYGDNNKGVFPQIVLKPEDGVDNAEFVAMVEGQLGNYRAIKQ